MIVNEEAHKNDDTFAGALGLNSYQETHKMISNLDSVAPVVSRLPE